MFDYYALFPTCSSCQPYRSNLFSLNVWHAYLNKTSHWRDTDLVETFYENDLKRSASKAHKIKHSNASVVYFDNSRFLLSAKMEMGCKPILTVQLLPGEKYSYELWKAPGPNAMHMGKVVQEQRSRLLFRRS